MMSNKSVSAKESSFDPAVSVTEESKNSVQCVDVRLISSEFNPLIDEEAKPDQKIQFKIRAFIKENQAFSQLETRILFTPSNFEDISGFSLRFKLLVKFLADDNLPENELAEFVRFYTLTILWPYAREFASDQLRRAGYFKLILPIINPQIITKRLIEDELIEINCIDELRDK